MKYIINNIFIGVSGPCKFFLHQSCICLGAEHWYVCGLVKWQLLSELLTLEYGRLLAHLNPSMMHRQSWPEDKTLWISMLCPNLGPYMAQTHSVREMSWVKVINSLKSNTWAPRVVETKQNCVIIYIQVKVRYSQQGILLLAHHHCLKSLT